MKRFLLPILLFASAHPLAAAVFTIPNGDVAALIAALNTANTNGQADVINLAPNGVYVLNAVNYTSQSPGNTGYEGQRGLPNISNEVTGLDVTINGNGATIQRNASAPNFGLFSCGGQTVFNNLTLRNANVNAQGAAIFVQFKGNLEVNACSFYDNTSLLDAEGGGGAIYTKSLSVLTVKNSLFENNRAFNQGGAISNLLSNMTVLNSTFKNNRTTNLVGAAGGAIYDDGARGDSGFLTLKNNIFENNACPSGQGGAVFLFPYRNQAVEITGCSFTKNSADIGGGLWHRGGASPGIPDSEYPLSNGPENTTLLFNNCVFDGNTAKSQGGGTWISYCIINEIHSCTFKNNSAGLGGGVSLLTNRAFTFRNSTFNNNTAELAAGMATGGASEKLTIQNCTFAANIASKYGGALAVPQNGTPVDITNCTFANNQANNPGNGQSAAIHSGDNSGNNTVMIRSNIFYNQTVTNPWNVWKNCNSELKDGGNNLFFPENAGGRCVASPDKSLFVDPVLGALASNGGPTQTMALQAGSPAINAGSGCPAADQRGAPRAGACDIGAFEFGAALAAANAADALPGALGLYPNPSSGEVFLTLPATAPAGPVHVRVYALSGQLVLEQVLDPRQPARLLVPGKGLFLLQATVGNQRFSQKLATY